MHKFSVFNFFSKQKVIASCSLVGCSLLLTACAGTSGLSWSALSPSNWFSNSLKISGQGLGEINDQTNMVPSAIEKALEGKYHLRSGMETKNGKLISIVQGMDEDQVKLEFYGLPNGKVNRIDVLDEGIKTVWGTEIGTSFSALYDKAFGTCQRSRDFSVKSAVICTAPQSPHVSYVLTGIWNGPEELLPSDDVIKDWKISRIIWQSE
ncbi:RpoE-regulated lipoprotein [Xenorhabdus sp. 42]|uniref:RpoE-regulated lipoprotein n=1 Tax=Xenorhabdus szentirmaii TaxID=290112 RepID=UPI0019956FAC|nr:MULTISPECIES: RpoE-regulated lipoprotein [unclassified Xenorhabdus]MBD2782468.1 RpoE-regulated lipoprotein [Xenorhabdus sp. 38]MBD2820473.1 RpoE-regulated lipoprotein [Xenorhabdus sp. 42]